MRTRKWKLSKDILEWVMRGYYGFSVAGIAAVLNPLLALPQVNIEDRDTVPQALAHGAAGLELADALHHASYRDGASMTFFEDRQFAGRAKLSATGRL